MKKTVRLFIMVVFAALAVQLSACSFSKAEKLYEDGRVLYSKGEYEKACDRYEEAISRNSQNASYYIDYGFVLLRLEKFEVAIEQFDRVIVENRDIKLIMENNKCAYRGRGIAYFMLENYEKAAEDFSRALDIKVMEELDDDILYYLVYSRLRLLQTIDTESPVFSQRLDEISKESEKLLDKITDEENKEYLEQLLGDIYMLLGEYDKAYKVINAYSADKAVLSGEVYIKLAICSLEAGDFSQAELYLKMAEQNGGAKQEIAVNRIILLERKQLYEEAYALLKEYLKSYPLDEKAAAEADLLERLIASKEEK